MKEINNNIEEKCCGLELSKLLKEKGFDRVSKFKANMNDTKYFETEYLRYWYDARNNSFPDIIKPELELRRSGTNSSWFWHLFEFYQGSDKMANIEYYEAPSHSIVVEWIDVNFGIELFVFPLFREKCGYDSFRRDGFSFEIIRTEPCQHLDWTMFNQCAEDRETSDDKSMFKSSFKNRHEAMEAGLLYILKNLIKVEDKKKE
jgi:hypothetical protein